MRRKFIGMAPLLTQTRKVRSNLMQDMVWEVHIVDHATTLYPCRNKNAYKKIVKDILSRGIRSADYLKAEFITGGMKPKVSPRLLEYGPMVSK